MKKLNAHQTHILPHLDRKGYSFLELEAIWQIHRKITAGLARLLCFASLQKSDNTFRKPYIVEKFRKRLFLPSLAVSAFAVAISNGLVTLLLLEIASTFQVNEGIAVQLRTVNAAAEVVLGLLMSFLAVRFRHKNLLLVGLSLVAVSAVGSFLAPTLSLMLFFSFIEGSGSIMVAVTSFTLIGDSLPLDKKAKAVSWLVAAGYLFSFIGTPLISFFADIGSWRYAFSLLVLPVSIGGIFLVILGVPSSKIKLQQSALSIRAYLNMLKQTFLNKSVASCLLGGLFFTGSAFGVFAIAFYRQHYLISRTDSVYILLVVAFLAIVGSLIAGQIGNRFSSKSLTVASVLGSGVFSSLVFFVPCLWIALVFNFLATVCITMATSAYHCLVLEQVPHSRSTTMSLYRVFSGTGCIIAPALAGGLLASFASSSIVTSYLAVGIGFGAMNIFAACLLYFFTKSTC